MKKVLFILGQLSDRDVDWMRQHGEKRRIPSGSLLIEEGKPVDAIYIVLNGALTVTTEALKGEAIARLSAGEMVGEMSFVDARPPVASVRAIEDSIVLAIPRQRLDARLKEDPGFAARFYLALATFMSDRLRTVTEHLGYGKPRLEDSADDLDFGDELDDNVLDNIHLAGQRFDRLLRRLMAE